MSESESSLCRLLSFSWLSTSRLIRIIRNNPRPRKPAFEWVRCGDQGDWQSLPKNKMTRPAWHDSRFQGFFVIPSSIFGVRSSKRQRWQERKEMNRFKEFCVPCPWAIFLVLLSINQSRGFASTQSLHSPSTETKVFSGHAPQAKPSLPLEQFPGKPPARSAGKWSCSWYCKEQTLLTKV